MPLVNQSAYHECICAFIEHWLQYDQKVNPAFPIVLAGGFDCDTLIADLQRLNEAQALLLSLVLKVSQLAGQRDIHVEILRSLIAAFNLTARAYGPLLTSIDLVACLPPVPPVRTKPERMKQLCTRVNFLWQQIHDLAHPEIPTPLILSGGQTQEQFNAARATLEDISQNLVAAQLEARRHRLERDHLVKNRIKPRLIEYRARIQSVLHPTHPHVQTLPLVYRPRKATARTQTGENPSV
ncbi:MAG: hypothetical protein SFY80_12735 [Verrucomicrobiota bacterium]|nr:hypothetical protein [Verrucomicrobiota bacterium]